MQERNIEDDKVNNWLKLTAEIVAAQVSNNRVEVSELPQLIQSVYQAISEVESGFQDPMKKRPEPAVPVNKSIKPNYIICLEDGKKLKMLKRHLKTAYNMTPEQYKDRWGLGADYPMVAPEYAKQRSELAKSIGLGSRTRKKTLRSVISN